MRAQTADALDLQRFRNAPWRVVGADGADTSHVVVRRVWEGSRCRSTITNGRREGVQIREVVLFDVNHGLSPETPIYGEGFQMLSQTGGTIGRPSDLGNYTDFAD